MPLKPKHGTHGLLKVFDVRREPWIGRFHGVERRAKMHRNFIFLCRPVVTGLASLGPLDDVRHDDRTRVFGVRLADIAGANKRIQELKRLKG